MIKRYEKDSVHQAKYFFLICLIGFLVLISEGGCFVANAQLFGGGAFMPLLNTVYRTPFPFYGMPFPLGIPLFPPAIRQPVFGGGWALTGLSGADMRLAMPSPRPVLRRAATTVSILITNGPTAALLIINPTLLYGQPTSLLLPTAPTLPALFSGKPLIFGSVPITASNVQIFNYIANTFVLPTGIVFYIIP